MSSWALLMKIFNLCAARHGFGKGPEACSPPQITAQAVHHLSYCLHHMKKQVRTCLRVKNGARLRASVLHSLDTKSRRSLYFNTR